MVTKAVPYDRQTINSPNPIARYAHRQRIRTSVGITLAKLDTFADPDANVLDYGCGPGYFVSQLNKARPNCAIGFEPFRKDRGHGVTIVCSKDEIDPTQRFSVITLLETIEHLSPEEIDEFLDFARSVLSPSGGVVVSGPIELGPSLILKELSRSLRSLRNVHLPGYTISEFLKASIFAIAPPRWHDIRRSHKGFDFREAIQNLKARGWDVEVLGYGPLPTGTWYGNSQFYLWIRP